MKSKTVLYSFMVIAISVSSIIYYLIVDGRIPNKPNYEIRLAELRELTNTHQEKRPHTIKVEILARDDVPTFATQAGLDFSTRQMIRTAFLLLSDDNDTLIDIGMDRFVSQKFESGKEYYDDAFGRINQAIANCDIITVTHEHPDHIGYLARYPDLASIKNKLRLTKEQIVGTAIYSNSISVPTEISRIQTLSSTDYTKIAPGVVMIPAPGHTPGSVMFYVRMQDDSELIFVGDIVWNISNIKNSKGRPRLIQNFLMQTPEQRSAVYNQISALIELVEKNPTITLIPSHDEEHLLYLINSGLIQKTFN